MTKRILLILTISLVALGTNGCTGAKFDRGALEIQDGAILKEGVLKEGINIKVEPGAVDIKPGAFQGPVLKVDKDAFNFTIQPGAVTFQEGAVVLNVMSKRKGPYLDTTELKKSLEGLKKLGDLSSLPEDVRIHILGNEAIYQNVIQTLIKMIEEYNSKFADPPAEAGE